MKFNSEGILYASFIALYKKTPSYPFDDDIHPAFCYRVCRCGG